jgi:hypothetical protein
MLTDFIVSEFQNEHGDRNMIQVDVQNTSSGTLIVRVTNSAIVAEKWRYFRSIKVKAAPAGRICNHDNENHVSLSVKYTR